IAERFGTPSYVYSRAAIEFAYREFDQACSGRDVLICYSVKANSNLAVLNVLARLGSGFDIVSGGELARVLAVGGSATKSVFSGVGKSVAEMRAALQTGVLCFNVESEDELERLAKIAAELGKIAPVSLRINPDVDPRTHPHIATGLRETKFGVPYEEAPRLYRKAASMPSLQVVGIDFHIGSQLTEIEPFVAALNKALEFIDALMNDLLRPALYDAWHEILPVLRRNGPAQRYDIVGPVCESADFLARERALTVAVGDLLAIMSAGAYGMTMSSNYNSRPRPPEVIVDGKTTQLVRDRESVEDRKSTRLNSSHLG